MQIGSYAAILLYVLSIIAISYYSYARHSSMSDYLIGSRSLGPVTTALSAGASDMSGWMLLGVPGAAYISGLGNIWMIIGLCIGAYCNYLFLAKRLRIYTEVAKNSITIPDFLENRFKDKSGALRLVSGLLILVFFTLYVSSGIIAGGKSFESFFGISFAYGALATLAIVIFYTFFGGFKTVALTDAFQGMLMFIVLISVPLMTYLSLNLPDNTSVFSMIKSLNQNALNPFYNQSLIGIIGLLAWGFGYFGQPHIIVRFMAIKSSSDLDSARRIGIGWMGLGMAGAMASGMLGFVYFSNLKNPLSDPETVFLQLGSTLFHPFFLGVIISAVLAAIMSTLASQLLVSASSVSKDFVLAFYKKELSQVAQVRITQTAVLCVGAVATALAFASSDTVLKAVGNAWAGFGASFGPVLLFSLYWGRTSAAGALWGMISGGVSVLLWIYLGLSEYVYEMLPAVVISSAVIVIASLASKKTTAEIAHEFNKVKSIITKKEN
ncbi:sodium/proline symporter PutP [Campylobacter sp. 19-13652]|uniref:sodium/proline symporter PutP n=1 Tax=Campylobacter sp. 19-13652 TaxID=2840180 RepID=UPI001C76A397|nr:sodium/proline symporter PutP [Campylobacter sp. 19-13652]BCX79806.1 sodium:proline symporter [Campylobacter sp. 19-13652]